MEKKLILIIALFISILLLPLPLYARGGVKAGGLGKIKGGGLGGVKRSGGGKSSILGSLFGDSNYVTPAAKSHGILSIMVESQEAEIYVNDRFIGMAKDFKGPALVSVPEGKQVIEFKYDGMDIPVQEFEVFPNSTTFIIRESFELNAKSP